MNIDGYVERLRADLVAMAAAGGDATVDIARQLTTSLDAAVRMAMLEALADFAAEVTAVLDGATVEVRLRGRDPDVVVMVDESSSELVDPLDGSRPSPIDRPGGDSEDPPGDEVVARITLRLPETLKQRAEAAASSLRQSLNSWLVDAVDAAADHDPAPPGRARRRGTTHLSGWAR